MKTVFKLSALFCCLLCSTSILAKTFKISTSAPDGSYWMKQMRLGAKEIKKQTEGRVKFKYYPGGIMGSEHVVLKKIRIRQLQGAIVSNGGVAGFYPNSQLYTLPMMFRNYQEVDYIRALYDKKIIEGIEKAGMISFGLSEGGFAYPMSTKSIEKIEDLKSQKIWSPSNNKQALLTLESFGLTPIPLSIGDVLVGLQTHLIDAVAVPPIGAIVLQWHTQIKYITNIPLSYVYATLIIDKKAFKKISEADQKIVTKIMVKAFERIDKQNRKDNISAFNALIEQGITVISPNDKSMLDWNKKGKIARDYIESKNIFSDGVITEVNKLLQKFRLKNPSLGLANIK